MSTAKTNEPTAPERWWFTFGGDHTHPETGENLAKAYVVLEGTCDETREQMFASAFGNRWALQYASAERAGVDKYGLHEAAMPAATDSKIWACPEPDCGYHVADGPAPDGEPSTAVLISEHLEEHTLDRQAAATERDDAEQTAIVEEDADDRRVLDIEARDEAATEVAEATPALRLVEDLRKLADFVVAHPELAPHMAWSFRHLLVSVAERDEVVLFARAGMRDARIEKHQDDNWAGVNVFVGDSVSLHVYASRDEVCERIVTGTRKVRKTVPDPEALKAVPTVTVTEVVEDVEWRCGSLLAPEPRQVAAAALTPDAPELPAEVVA